MKDIIKSTILASIGFAVIMTLFMVLYFDANPVTGFLFNFFGFGILIFLFQLFMLKKNKKIAKDIRGKIYYQGPANYFLGTESVGGYLFITKNKLIFKSHSFNIQNQNVEILLKNITEVKTYNTLGIIPNGLKIIQKEKTDIFVVNNRLKIMQILNKNNK